MIAGYASVSSGRTGAKIHQIANQKRDFIEKYVNLCIRFGTCEFCRSIRGVLFDKLVCKPYVSRHPHALK